MLWRQQLRVLRQQPGIQYVTVARRIEPDGGQEAVLFEEWRDADSLYAWVGPNLAEPRLVDGIRELATQVEVTHYEALMEPEREDSDDASSSESDEPTVPNGSGHPPGGGLSSG
jgi:heme-degrading monooxygenase HmoA